MMDTKGGKLDIPFLDYDVHMMEEENGDMITRFYYSYVEGKKYQIAGKFDKAMRDLAKIDFDLEFDTSMAQSLNGQIVEYMRNKNGPKIKVG